MDNLRVGIVGAMGAVGKEILRTLENRAFPASEPVLLDIGENVGQELSFQGERIRVENSVNYPYENLDIVFLAVDAEVSKRIAKPIAAAGTVVIDNSNCWRLDPEVPLVIPEVNPEEISKHNGIIANPNCTTIIALTALYPLHKAAGIERMVVSTYQAVSGAGLGGIDELLHQLEDLAAGREVKPEIFQEQIAFNLIPQIDAFDLDNLYTQEELKLHYESRKILKSDHLNVSCTCVRVPVIRCHAESILIETREPLSVEDARELLRNAPGVRLLDNPAELSYPTPLQASDTDDIFVGRIRQDLASGPRGLNLWVCGDQLRKGAALNAVQIAEQLVKNS